MKKSLSLIAALALFSVATPIMAAADSTTSTATISFYNSDPASKQTSTGKSIPTVENIKYTDTTITHYKVDTWRDMPIINLFTNHKTSNDFYGVSFKTMNHKKHEVKLSNKQAKTYLNNHNDPIKLTSKNGNLLINNESTQPMPKLDK